MTGTPITWDDFQRKLDRAHGYARRGELQKEYAEGDEAADFELFRAGTPRKPEELEWWWDWQAKIKRLTSAPRNVEVARVAVVDDPPSWYQRWRQWAIGPALQAGERIYWMTARQAQALRLDRSRDWWLIDDEVIVLEFGPALEASLILYTDAATVDRYKETWDLATRNAAMEQLQAA